MEPGPRRRILCQRERDTSRPARRQLRRRGPQGSGTAVGPQLGERNIRALRAVPSTHSARPWPQPWRSMKPSCRSRFQRSTQSSVMKDARPSGLGGSSKVVGLKGISVFAKHIRRGLAILWSWQVPTMRSTKTCQPFFLRQ